VLLIIGYRITNIKLYYYNIVLWKFQYLIQIFIKFTEVSLMEWKTYDECMKDIHHYNIEKKRLLTRIEEALIQIWKFL
jgi:hypothetical protein